MKSGNIILIGFMGSGKSTVGRKLSSAFHYHFMDTDALVEERKHKSIATIFATEGEEAFRKAETEVLRELVKELTAQSDGAPRKNQRRFVLATGGGLPLREENVVLLRQLGTVVYLAASPEEILKRMKNDHVRPLLQTPDKETRVRELFACREPIYKAAADRQVDTDGKSFYGILQEIKKRGIVKGER